MDNSSGEDEELDSCGDEELSNYYSEEDELMGSGSSDDDGPMSILSKKLKAKQYKEEPDKKELPKLERGMVFKDLNHVSEVITEHAFKSGFQLERSKNEG